MAISPQRLTVYLYSAHCLCDSTAFLLVKFRLRGIEACPAPCDDVVVVVVVVEERRAGADLIEVYKIIHGISSVSFDTFFKFNSYGMEQQEVIIKKERRLT